MRRKQSTDFLQKKRKTNNGEIPQYYAEEHHEAIIPTAQFDFVQAELARRRQNGRYSGHCIDLICSPIHRHMICSHVLRTFSVLSRLHVETEVLMSRVSK